MQSPGGEERSDRLFGIEVSIGSGGALAAMVRRALRRLALAALLLGCAAAPSAAHEFWLDPSAFVADVGAETPVRLRVGENFEGVSQIYDPAQFARFDITVDGAVAAAEGRLGDDPATQWTPERRGLHIAVHQTRHRWLQYNTWEKFASFARNHGAEAALEAHAARGLPREGFREGYVRFAKALMLAGGPETAAKQRDAASGLEFELVALDNPYAAADQRTIRVLALYQGAPWANGHVTLFERVRGETAAKRDVATNADGVAEIPVRQGAAYLVNAVVLRPPSAALAAQEDIVWESLWASLTFATLSR